MGKKKESYWKVIAKDKDSCFIAGKLVFSEKEAKKTCKKYMKIDIVETVVSFQIAHDDMPLFQ